MGRNSARTLVRRDLRASSTWDTVKYWYNVDTRILAVGENAESALEEAANVIKTGGVVAFPTETVYGLGVRYGDARASAYLEELKGRPEGKPFQVLIDRLEALEELGVLPCPRAGRLMERFWPGPLTLVVPTAAGGDLGVRLPAVALVCSLIRASGGALTATSANPAGGEPAVDAEQVASMFDGRIDLILDGGQARIGTASTVARILPSGIEVLREGTIDAKALQDCWKGR